MIGGRVYHACTFSTPKFPVIKNVIYVRATLNPTRDKRNSFQSVFRAWIKLAPESEARDSQKNFNQVLNFEIRTFH